MGQYWRVFNLDLKECLKPQDLQVGLTLQEQLGSVLPTAVMLLCAAHREHRGGGEVEVCDVVGRWAGHRIAWVGDYAKREDLPEEFEAETLYERVCDCPEGGCSHGDRGYRNISQLVWPVLLREMPELLEDLEPELR